MKYEIGDKLVVTGIDIDDPPDLEVGQVVTVVSMKSGEFKLRVNVEDSNGEEWYIDLENVKQCKKMFTKTQS